MFGEILAAEMSLETGATAEDAPPDWIKQGVGLMVTDGKKNFPYVAKTESDPFLVDDEWFVTVRWGGLSKVEDVACSRCSQIDLEEKGRERLRKRRLKQSKQRAAKVERKSKFKSKEKPKPKKSDGHGSRVSDVVFVDLTGDDEETSWLKPVSLVDSLCKPPSDNTPISPVARMPPLEEDSDDDTFSDIQPTSPSPERNRSYSRIVSDDHMLATDESDLESDLDKKPAAPASPTDKDASREERRKQQFEVAKKALSELSYTPQEINAALRKIGPPYKRLQIAALNIQQMREKKAAAQRRGVVEPFEVEIGMEIRRPFDGTLFSGEVIFEVEEETFKDGKPVRVWKVKYEDGDTEDLEYDELLRFRYPPPVLAPCRGRAMQCLELFCGRGVVSQEFRQRLWKVISVDIDEDSNATIKSDILTIGPSDLEFVPDFIWASLPCHTYSNMAGGRHRNVGKGKYEISEEARLNNLFFTQMVKFMNHARSLHPHLIVAIENPVGALQHMPLMVSLGMFRSDVSVTCSNI